MRKRLLCIAATAILFGACSKRGSSGSGVSTGSISPANDSFIADSQTITVTFADSMDISSLVLGGAMASETLGALWSGDSSFTLTPMSTWSEGVDRSLTISGKTSAGVDITPLTLNYDVVICDTYVTPMGSDANPGTSASPKLTIASAISAAPAAGTVCVAEGTYSVSTATTLTAGIKIYGGFKSGDWLTNDPSVYPSIVTDTRTSGGTSTNPNKVFFASGNLSNGLLAGFIVNGGGGSYSSAFATNNAYYLVLKQNTLNGGSGSTGSRGAFLYLDAINEMILKRNTINGGTGGSSAGVYLMSSSATVADNTILAGSGTNNYGVYLDVATSGSITGNYVSGGTGTNSHGLYVSISNDTISGNTFWGGSGTANSYGVYVTNSTAPYPTLTGNTVFGGAAPTSTGIYVVSANATLKKNSVQGGSGNTASRGIYINAANVLIHTNLVHGGTSANQTAGVVLFNPTSATLRANTIDGGSPSGRTRTTQANAILISGADKPKMQNNLLFTSGGTTRYCINVQLLIVGYLLTFDNNALFDCPQSALYDTYSHCITNHDGDGDNKTCDVVDLNSAYTSSANASDAAVFVSRTGADGVAATLADNDWRLSALTSTTIKTGGLDGGSLSFGFNDDYAGVLRTGSSGTGWSMGAHEEDG